MNASPFPAPSVHNSTARLITFVDDYLPWIMFGLTCIIFFIALWRFFVVVISRANHFTTVTKAIHSLLPLALGALAAHRLYQNIKRFPNRPTFEQLDVEEISLGGFPGYLYLCTFLILVLFWAVRFYQDSQAAEAIKTAYFGLVAIVVSVWFGFLVLFSIFAPVTIPVPDEERKRFVIIHQVELCFSTTVQLLGSACYFYFGTKMWHKMRESSTTNPRLQKTHRLIGFLTIFETVILSLRAIMLLLISWIPLPEPDFGIVFTIYSIIFDLLPPVVIMVLLGQPAPRTIGAKAYLVNNPHFDQSQETNRLIFGSSNNFYTSDLR